MLPFLKARSPSWACAGFYLVTQMGSKPRHDLPQQFGTHVAIDLGIICQISSSILKIIQGPGSAFDRI